MSMSTHERMSDVTRRSEPHDGNTGKHKKAVNQRKGGVAERSEDMNEVMNSH